MVLCPNCRGGPVGNQASIPLVRTASSFTPYVRSLFACRSVLEISENFADGDDSGSRCWMVKLTLSSDTNDECSLSHLWNTIVCRKVETIIHSVSLERELG